MNILSSLLCSAVAIQCTTCDTCLFISSLFVWKNKPKNWFSHTVADTCLFPNIRLLYMIKTGTNEQRKKIQNMNRNSNNDDKNYIHPYWIKLKKKDFHNNYTEESIKHDKWIILKNCRKLTFSILEFEKKVKFLFFGFVFWFGKFSGKEIRMKRKTRKREQTLAIRAKRNHYHWFFYI